MIGAAFLARLALNIGIPARFHKLVGYGMVAVLIGLAVWQAFAWHGRQVRGVIVDTIAKRDAAWKQRLDAEHAQAIKWKAERDAANAKLTAAIRSGNDANKRRIDAELLATGLRGPGKAAAAAYCRQGDHSSAAGSAVRREGGAGAQADDAVGSVPAARGSDLIVVPFADLLKFTGQHDRCLSDVAAVIRQHDALAKDWPSQQLSIQRNPEGQR